MYDTQEKRKNSDVSAYVTASFGSRFVAYLIDGFVISLVGGLVVGTTRHAESFALSTLVGFIYYWYFWTQRDGQTPGKAIMHIRVIKTSGEPMTAGDVIVRMVGYWISGMFFALGFLWAAFDSRGQGWHDKIAGTYVVEAEPEEKKKKYVTV
ncbi:MAG: RDD family protein [Anaerolineae bacterium]|nr:RDD family protein [Anaerolineae bacterium]